MTDLKELEELKTGFVDALHQLFNGHDEHFVIEVVDTFLYERDGIVLPMENLLWSEEDLDRIILERYPESKHDELLSIPWDDKAEIISDALVDSQANYHRAVMDSMSLALLRYKMNLELDKEEGIA